MNCQNKTRCFWSVSKPFGPKTRSMVSVFSAVLLLMNTIGCSHQAVLPQHPMTPAVFQPLQDDIQKSYLELFKISPTLEYTDAQILSMQDYLNKAKDYCVAEFKKRSDQYNKEIQDTEKKLKSGDKLTEDQKHSLRCQLQTEKALKSQTDVIADHAIPVAYQNKQAKLELIQKWPPELKQIKQDIADGSYINRRWGDVKDIGFREIAPGQKDDISTGQQAIEQMKQAGLMPPAVEDKAVVDYVNSVAQKVASHSDLRVPLHVTVLNAKEINAFALPGGFLFVERGLLEAADDEAELAGVLGHEISHVVARHGHKLMVKEEIASIIFQAAQVAAIVLTGGIAGIGTYYALQYGFYGLSLAMNLELLGISREYELQADQLGIQYAWNSGYDPSGFIRFFDKMATEEGYVNGISWFYDHPPFYERMVDAEKEIMFLPKKEGLITNTPEFGQMKQALSKVTEKAETESKNRPSLENPEKGCPPPQKLEYEPNKPIETICTPPTSTTTSNSSN